MNIISTLQDRVLISLLAFKIKGLVEMLAWFHRKSQVRDFNDSAVIEMGEKNEYPSIA